jgi:hypothetical protein
MVNGREFPVFGPFARLGIWHQDAHKTHRLVPDVQCVKLTNFTIESVVAVTGTRFYAYPIGTLTGCGESVDTQTRHFIIVRAP